MWASDSYWRLSILALVVGSNNLLRQWSTRGGIKYYKFWMNRRAKDKLLNRTIGLILDVKYFKPWHLTLANLAIQPQTFSCYVA